MNANKKETIEQFVKRMRSDEDAAAKKYKETYGCEGLIHATKVLTNVTRELGIKQAEMTERLATAIETIADQHQRQFDPLGSVGSGHNGGTTPPKGQRTHKKEEFKRACGRVFR